MVLGGAGVVVVDRSCNLRPCSQVVVDRSCNLQAADDHGHTDVYTDPPAGSAQHEVAARTAVCTSMGECADAHSKDEPPSLRTAKMNYRRTVLTLNLTGFGVH